LPRSTWRPKTSVAPPPTKNETDWTCRPKRSAIAHLRTLPLDGIAGPASELARRGRSRYTICHSRGPRVRAPSSLSHVSRGCFGRHANLIPKRDVPVGDHADQAAVSPTEELRSQLAPESGCFLDRIVRRCDQYVDRRNGEFSAGVDRSDTARIPDGLFARPDSSRDPQSAQLLRSRSIMSSRRTQHNMRFPRPSLLWSYVRTSGSLRRIVGLTVVYFLVCKLGLSLAIIHPSATAVWPGTGIALAAILIFGYSMWSGIFLGALAVNLTTAGSIVSALGIAFGNTLEAVLGAYLVIRFANGRNVFDRAEGIFKFFLLACVVATTASASIGTASLALTGFSRGVRWESLWSTWWLGNMAGAILVTPCFLLWSSRTEALGRPRRVVLQSIALVSLLLAGAIVFGGFGSVAGQDYALKFLCIPIAVWVAFECRPRETALAVLGFSVIAVGSALHAGRSRSTKHCRSRSKSRKL